MIASDAIRYALERIAKGRSYGPDMRSSRELCYADATYLLDQHVLTAEQFQASQERAWDRPVTNETHWQLGASRLSWR